MINTKHTKVKEDLSTRQLKLAYILLGYLEKVSGYKAFNKLQDLFYNKPEKGMNKNYYSLRKTDYSLCIFKVTYLENAFNLTFRDDKNQASPITLEFRITKKDIPTFHQELKEKISYLEENKNNLDVSIPDYAFERVVESIFQDEFTKEKFNKTKKELLSYLDTLKKQVQEIKY